VKGFFSLVSLTTILLIGCKKYNDSDDQIIPAPQYIFANAGPDTLISSPLPGSGWYYSTILNGKASYSTVGRIISFSWTAIDQGPFDFFIVSDSADSTDLFIMEWPDFQKPKTVSHLFRLEVRDDFQNVDFDTVSVATYRKILAEYRELSWDSTVGSYSYLNIKPKTGEIVNYQPFYGNYPTHPDILSLCDYNSDCTGIANWRIIPWVPYDSILLTDKSLFYSSSADDPDVIDNGEAWVVIYATPQSGIDFTRKLAVGVYRLN
jgi:hypothetical protein